MAHENYDLAALKARLGGIRTEDNPALVRQKSRDFYWYSPTLKRQLDAVNGDIVAFPTSEDEVLSILAACFDLGIPVTPRGAGTGNYGQAMPLAGGLVLDLSGLDKVLEIAPGRVRAQAGAILADIDEACAASGQELRLHPSTYRTASIGGFIAGGSGGVGSITWGGLRDLGNIVSLRIATMEAEPAHPPPHRRGGAEGLARLRHQRHHPGSRDAARACLWLDRGHDRLCRFR